MRSIGEGHIWRFAKQMAVLNRQAECSFSRLRENDAHLLSRAFVPLDGAKKRITHSIRVVLFVLVEAEDTRRTLEATPKALPFISPQAK